MTLEESLKAFKPEFGNPAHLHILELSQKIGRKKELLKKTKAAKTSMDKLIKEIKENEKKLLASLKFDYDKRR